jgi:hypothetical protein
MSAQQSIYWDEEDQKPRIFIPERCRSCEAPILWAFTESGKLMPVDYEPRWDGNIGLRFCRNSGRRYLVAVYLTQADLHSRLWPERFVSHFVSCSDSDSWRRRKSN